VRSYVALTGGRLPHDLAVAIPEEYVDGWIIAIAESQRGERFDFTLDRRGRYVGFGKPQPDPSQFVEFGNT
jgi:hypothetical protein